LHYFHFRHILFDIAAYALRWLIDAITLTDYLLRQPLITPLLMLITPLRH